MRVFLVGDIHGNPNIISNSKWPEGKELTQDDLVIFLGDFGLYWSNPADKDEKYWLNWLAAKPFNIAFVDGNHENFDVINAFPEETKWGGKVGADHRFGGTIWHLKRGEIFDFNNKKTFVLGGADSIDKAHRSEGFSWWAAEQHSRADETNALDNLDKVNWKVDHVLTHTCPNTVISAFLDCPNDPKFRDPVAHFLEFIANKLEFKTWDLGHFHNDRSFADAGGDLFRCHFKLITELK
jgi:predicted phosphodiesterase